jgi:hypothetical protein
MDKTGVTEAVPRIKEAIIAAYVERLRILSTSRAKLAQSVRDARARLFTDGSVEIIAPALASELDDTAVVLLAFPDLRARVVPDEAPGDLNAGTWTWL